MTTKTLHVQSGRKVVTVRLTVSYRQISDPAEIRQYEVGMDLLARHAQQAARVAA